MKELGKLIMFFLCFQVGKGYSTEVISSAFTCEYKQERFLQKMDLTLISKGKVSLSIDQTILWIQNQPFTDVVVIKKDGAYQLLGETKVELKNPIIKKMTEIIGKVLKGEEDELSQYFEVNKDVKKIAKLTPKDENLKRIINIIEVKTSNYIESFLMKENDGSFIEINFSSCEKIKI